MEISREATQAKAVEKHGSLFAHCFLIPLGLGAQAYEIRVPPKYAVMQREQIDAVQDVAVIL